MFRAPPPPSEESGTLHVYLSETIVAGYFEEGRWIPVTFEEYVRLIWDSATPPAYLKPAPGFVGMLVMKAKPGIPLPDVAVPQFEPGVVPEIRVRQ